MSAILIVIGLTLLYLVAQEVVRRWHWRVMWCVFGAVPLALTPYWFRTNELDLFLWIKIYSIMFCLCWGSWLRFSKLATNRRCLQTIGLLLIGNVLEATLVDLLAGGWAHGVNAAAGTLLMLTLPFGLRRTYIDTSGPRDLRLDIPLSWIIGYSAWNWTFVYLNYPSYSGHHAAILAAALIVALLDRKRWVQARAATLGLSLLPTATSFSGMLTVIDATDWYDCRIATGAAILSAGWMLVHALALGQFKVSLLATDRQGRSWWFTRRASQAIVSSAMGRQT